MTNLSLDQIQREAAVAMKGSVWQREVDDYIAAVVVVVADTLVLSGDRSSLMTFERI